MKAVYYCILVCCLCLVSCQCQTKDKKMNADLNVSLLFYPIIEDVRYSIDIEYDSLVVKNFFIGVETTARVKLTDEQLTAIKKLTSKLKRKYDKPESERVVYGAWGCTLKVDNQVYYEDDFFSFIPQSKTMGWQPPPKEIKLLIDYIVSLSPIPIELYGFS